MQYRQLGTSGMRVSKLCFGTMRMHDKNKDEMMRAMLTAMDLGVNFIDSADCYGMSEEVVGKTLEETGRRDEVVLATKAVWYMGDGANDYGASRIHLTKAIEDSLRKLRTDHVDLYVLHVVDPNTPLLETLRTLDDMVRQGKVRYIGTSKWPAALIVEALGVSEREGLEHFVSEQPPYNLLDRSAENELAWVAKRHGLGLTPFFPLASGVLSGKYKRDEEAPRGTAMAKRKPSDKGGFTNAAIEVADALKPLAEERGITVAELALAWLMCQKAVTSVVLGARTEEYARSGVKASEVELTEEDLARIDEIVPPGEHVADFYPSCIYKPARFDYSSEARRTRAGAYIPDTRTGSGLHAPED